MHGLAFSPDGSRIATGEQDNQLVRLWNVPDLELLATFQGHTNEVYNVCFSPDGRTLVSTGKENTVRFWTVPPEASAERDATNEARIRFDNLSVGMQKWASFEADGTTQFWKTEGGRLIREFRLNVHERDAGLMVFSNDGKLAAVGGSSKDPEASKEPFVEIYDCLSGASIQRIPFKDDGVLRVDVRAISPDNQMLVATVLTETACDWTVIHLETRREMTRLHEPVKSRPNNGLHAVFSLDGRVLAYPGRDWTFRLWDLQEGKELAVLEGHYWTAYTCQTTRSLRDWEGAKVEKYRGFAGWMG